MTGGGERLQASLPSAGAHRAARLDRYVTELAADAVRAAVGAATDHHRPSDAGPQRDEQIVGRIAGCTEQALGQSCGAHVVADRNGHA
jgi:hypothetical protein